MTGQGQRYSVIPSKSGGVHAVYDKTIRRAFFDGTHRVAGLSAVCGEAIFPCAYLTAARLCPNCATALRDTDIPRPAPGNPLLTQMAILYPGGAR
ncbi:MAG: hypothetical protein J2P19_08465 [Pseudonocardia sp.]|nr:hypothetical protein [Pseudonocardia sp.]